MDRAVAIIVIVGEEKVKYENEQLVYLLGFGAMVPLIASIHVSLSDTLVVSNRYALQQQRRSP